MWCLYINHARRKQIKKKRRGTGVQPKTKKPQETKNEKSSVLQKINSFIIPPQTVILMNSIATEKRKRKIRV